MDPGFERADVPRRDGEKGSERAIGRRARAYLRGVGLLDGRLPLLHDGILRDGRDTAGMRPVRRAREPRPRRITLVVATAGERGGFRGDATRPAERPRRTICDMVPLSSRGVRRARKRE
jgi:hypothetical protein